MATQPPFITKDGKIDISSIIHTAVKTFVQMGALSILGLGMYLAHDFLTGETIEVLKAVVQASRDIVEAIEELTRTVRGLHH